VKRAPYEEGSKESRGPQEKDSKGDERAKQVFGLYKNGHPFIGDKEDTNTIKERKGGNWKKLKKRRYGWA